jgi:glycosyltransferase involved in cell wall biosynthesis
MRWAARARALAIHIRAASRLVRWYGPAALAARTVQYVRHQRMLVQGHQALPARPCRLVRPPTEPRVLFVHDSLEGLTATVRYRAHNMREYLLARGIAAEVTGDNDIRIRPAWMLSFDAIVLVRLAMHPALSDLIQAARQRGVKVLYDVDDLIWEPAMLEVMDWSAEDRERYILRQSLYCKALESCDLAILPTNYLADKVSKLGKTAAVVSNGVNQVQLEAAHKILAHKVPKDFVAVGYFSGTATHRRDFEQASGALLRLLTGVPNLRLVIGGYLTLPPEFRDFKTRIVRVPLVRWDKLPEKLALADVNIAPLEVGNPFCESKSELKYFEAGLLEIPTVASATGTFRNAIRQGENGFLATTSQDWYESLRLLIEQPELRQRVGRCAREHVLRTYTEEPLGEAVFGVLQRALAGAQS